MPTDNVTGCINCKWEYVDTPGMGVHRAPLWCPRCGNRPILTMPPAKWAELQAPK